VWHASTAPLGKLGLSESYLRERAHEALEGVGNASLGQWEEYSGYAFHLRRRLTPEEQQAIGEIADIRGTPEQIKRWRRVRRFLPPPYQDWME